MGRRKRLRVASKYSPREARKALMAVAVPKKPRCGAVRYDLTHNEYCNTAVERGFPLGSIGSGTVHIGTAGGFEALTINNNWMRALRHLKGCFWALYTEQGGDKKCRLLRRRYSGGREYANATAIEEVRFRGRLPEFTMDFHGELPIAVRVQGFSPMVPHDVEDSSLPVAVFSVTLANTSDKPAAAAFLFSWQNVLGRGGTGATGVTTVGDVAVGCRPRVLYSSVAGNYQQTFDEGDLCGLSFRTDQQCPEHAHRRSVLGEHLLVVENGYDLQVTRNLGWRCDEKDAAILDLFAASGEVAGGIPRSEEETSLAAALSVSTELAAGEEKRLHFYLVWWNADHVVEMDVATNAGRRSHSGTRVGHYYQNRFSDVAQIAAYVGQHRRRLLDHSRRLNQLLDRSSLPQWAKIALPNATDSICCNSVLPKSGTLYTIEGQDWRWHFGGLTGTNDQRLAAHPYTSLFFTELDHSEVDTFRRLSVEGSVPHGNGNCDMGLSTAEIPYGWPLTLRGAMPEDRWPDLTISYILQCYRLYKMTATRSWLEQAWPQLQQMFAHLRRLENRHGIPEGGSTYDVFSFRGSFCYTASLYVAALEAGSELARDIGEANRAAEWEQRAAAAKSYIEETLWNPLGFYQATEDKATLFVGSLAGDWAARWCGLPPVLDSQRTRRHIENQHRVLWPHCKPECPPLRHSEFRYDGTPVPTKMLGLFPVAPYLWQVMAYYAMEAIYVGCAEIGMRTLEFFYRNFYDQGYPWSADLWGGAGFVYMTHPVLWALPNVVNGAVLDATRQTLTIAPTQIADEDQQTVPLFFPQFWADCRCDFSRKEGQLIVRRHFGTPLTIARIEHAAVDGAGDTVGSCPVEMETGVAISVRLSLR